MSTAFNLAMRPAAQGLPWREAARLLRGREWLVVGAGLAVAAGAALEVVPALLVQRLVDDHLVVGRAAGLPALAVWYLAASAGLQALSFATQYLAAITAQGALHDLRVRLIDHLLRLPMPYLDQTPLGDLISRCTADVDTLDALFSSGVAGLLVDALRLVTVMLALVALSPRLAALSALVIPTVWWVTRWFQARGRLAERESRRAVGGLTTDLQETLSGLETIHAFVREAVFVQRFRVALHAALAAYNRATAYASLYTPAMAVVAGVVVAGLLWAGAVTADQAWGVSVGTLTAFVLLFRRFFTPIVNLGEEWQTVQSALAGAERIFQVLALPVGTNARAPVAGDFDPAAGLALSDVTFGYQPDAPVLQGVSLRVRAGEQVALVGRTGAGKTSILHILAGMYAPWSGIVRVGGCDPRLLPEAERSRWIGTAPQAGQWFSGTVWDNVSLGDPRVTRAAVERAAAMTGAASLVAALPQGYDTILGSAPGQAQLSAGQRQLLALTRALAGNPPVLLLDEATALVDAATEAAFRQALRADGQHTVLVIAHRMATAQAADRVIVLEAGRVVEEGPPGTLARQNGRFAALLALEEAGWDWREGPPGESR